MKSVFAIAAATLAGQAMADTGLATDRLHEEAIFGNEIPEGIVEMEARVPPHKYNNAQVLFETPEDVLEKFDSEGPSSFLSGACLQTYLGYKDGKRLHDLADLMGQETIDLLVEWALFDFVLNDCAWMKQWGCVKDEWKYVSKQDSGVMRELESDHGFLITEVTDWFSYWIEMEHKEGMQLYADSLIYWKVNVINKFLSLKGLQVMVADDMPESLKKLKKKAAIDKKNGGKKGNGDLLLSKKRRLNADDDESIECATINPVEFFGEKWTHMSRFLKKYHGLDTSKPAQANKKGGDAQEKQNEKGADKSKTNELTTKVHFLTEACEGGVCIQIGAGLAWDVGTDTADIEWTYGLGTQRPMISPVTKAITDASTKLTVSVNCQANDMSDESHNILSFSKMTDKEDMEFGLLYDGKQKTNKNKELIGFSFTTGFGYSYDNTEDSFIGDDDVSFTYIHTGKLAQYAKGVNDRCPNKDKKYNKKKEKQENIFGKVGHTTSNHFGLLVILSLLAFAGSMLYKMCFTVQKKHLEGSEVEPLVKKGAVDRIYTQEDTYGLLPNMVNQDV